MVTERRVVAVIILKWVAVEIIVWAIVLAMPDDFIVFSDKIMACLPNYGATDQDVVTIAITVIFIFVPALCIMTMYCRILQISRRHVRQIRDSSVSSNGFHDNRQISLTNSYKSTKMMFVVGGCFIIAWFPYAVGLIYKSLTDADDLPEWLVFLAVWLAVSNSFWNVLIYSAMNTNFRRTLTQVLRSCTHCKKFQTNQVIQSASDNVQVFQTSRC
ncbi:histamine H2 receptor-like [Ptychodera flava]|uniref:histamine H2 receptor-like n=1 Tax=Ptychodera flava TaxID=63121 RepID=UPI00396A8618